MDCLDCLTESARHVAGVGVCADCGAGVCPDHAVIAVRRLTRPAVMLREIPVDPPARVVRCTICFAAHQSAHGADELWDSRRMRPGAQPALHAMGGR